MIGTYPLQVLVLGLAVRDRPVAQFVSEDRKSVSATEKPPMLCTHAFRSLILVKCPLVLFGLRDAGRVWLVFRRAMKSRGTVEAREGGVTLCSVVVQLWFLDDIAAPCRRNEQRPGR